MPLSAPRMRPRMDACHGTQSRRLRAGPFRLAETRHPAGLVLPRHAHEGACLHVVLGGVYRETTTLGSGAHGPRTVLFKPPGEPHSNDFRGGGAGSLRVEVDPAVRVPAIGPRHATDPGLVELASRLVHEVHHPDELSPLAAEALCLELLVRLGRAVHGGRGSADVARRAARVLEARYREPVRFGEVARELDVDRSALARSFRAHHRRTMGDYLRELRVGHVRRALVETDRPLAAIALEAGFADQSHCTRTFHRLVGTTPGRFRASARR